MNKIEQLTLEIEALEEQASKLKGTDYEALYPVLVTSFFKAKDIIELQKEINPIIDKDAVIELTKARDTVDALETESKFDKEVIRALREEYAKASKKLADIASVIE